MKSHYLLVLVILLMAISFGAGRLSGPLQQFDSCKSAYERLVASELCIGKSEEYWGAEENFGNVEYFDFNWDEDVGAYGETKDYVGGINQRCYDQADREYVESNKRVDLIKCFADEIEIVGGVLHIQCGCFFG